MGEPVICPKCGNEVWAGDSVRVYRDHPKPPAVVHAACGSPLDAMSVFGRGRSAPLKHKETEDEKSKNPRA